MVRVGAAGRCPLRFMAASCSQLSFFFLAEVPQKKWQEVMRSMPITSCTSTPCVWDVSPVVVKIVGCGGCLFLWDPDLQHVFACIWEILKIAKWHDMVTCLLIRVELLNHVESLMWKFEASPNLGRSVEMHQDELMQISWKVAPECERKAGTVDLDTWCILMPSKEKITWSKHKIKPLWWES